MGTIAGSVIALGADFLGSTSAILSLNPDFFRGLRADVLYPIGGYKRCLESSKGFGKLQITVFSSSIMVSFCRVDRIPCIGNHAYIRMKMAGLGTAAGFNY